MTRLRTGLLGAGAGGSAGSGDVGAAQWTLLRLRGAGDQAEDRGGEDPGDVVEGGGIQPTEEEKEKFLDPYKMAKALEKLDEMRAESEQARKKKLGEWAERQNAEPV